MKYKVIGDITCFHGMDRWGKSPVRIIYETNYYLDACAKARKHCSFHPHGSASVVTTVDDLIWAPVCDRLWG